jgi:nitrogen fixation protein NifB
MPLDLSQHPCFNDALRHRYGRVHLPVAPDCNVQCNFCDRRFNCVNESRPGVTTAVLSPHQALAYLDQALQRDPRITVVGIAGPGDPLANAEATLTTLRLVRDKYPNMLLCVASNGLNVPQQAGELAALQVSHVTLTVNAVDPRIGARIYAWVRDGRWAYRGEQAASLLLDRQLAAIRRLKSLGVLVKINTILIPTVNQDHVGEVARVTRELGADILNCIPMYCVESTPFADLGEPTAAMLAEARGAAGTHLPLMQHCTRCRADACGLIHEKMTDQQTTLLQSAARQPLVPQESRPHVAVASREGMLVNLHLGEASQLYIFRQQDGGYEFVETRAAPPAGGGGARRWEELGDTLRDCRAVLTTSAGSAPCEVLQRRGIRVVMMEGLVEDGLRAIYDGQDVRAPLRRDHVCTAGVTCGGNGMGCG